MLHGKRLSLYCRKCNMNMWDSTHSYEFYLQTHLHRQYTDNVYTVWDFWNLRNEPLLLITCAFQNKLLFFTISMIQIAFNKKADVYTDTNGTVIFKQTGVKSLFPPVYHSKRVAIKLYYMTWEHWERLHDFLDSCTSRTLCTRTIDRKNAGGCTGQALSQRRSQEK